MRNGIDWKGSILTWEHFTLNPQGPHNLRVEVGLVSLDGAPFGSVFPEKKLLTTREHAEVLAMSAGAQFLAVPYTRALAMRRGIDRLLGTWPGDESDETINAAIAAMS